MNTKHTTCPSGCDGTKLYTTCPFHGKDTKHTDSVEAKIQDFSSKFYYSIQQRQVKYEDLVDWLRTTLQATQSQQVEEAAKPMAVTLVKEFKDRLIDIAIANSSMRGCVTSNQIIELERIFWAETHPAFTPIHQQVEEAVRKERDFIYRHIVSEEARNAPYDTEWKQGYLSGIDDIALYIKNLTPNHQD